MMAVQDYAQPVIGPAGRAAIFLTVVVRAGQEEATREALSDVASIVRAVGFRVPTGQLTCVVGIGAGLWDRAYADLPLPRPGGLRRFAEIRGARHVAPATPGDLLFHVRGQHQDVCFELVHRLVQHFEGLIDIVDEVDGFRYWDNRDLLGFVDGTENPSNPAELLAAALLLDGPWTGSSYVIVQKYLHDLNAWDAMNVEQQEAAIGRRKLTDIELADDAKASNSHTVLNTIVDEAGVQYSIVRDNLPFGSVSAGEFGTYFIGYAADPSVTELMLRRMFIGVPEGNHDRLLDFSRAVTGCLFFVPPAAFLNDPNSLLRRAGVRRVTINSRSHESEPN